MIFMCVVTLIAVLIATETNTTDIAEEGSRTSRPTREPGDPVTE